MENLNLFSFGVNTVRVSIAENGDPWFVASDVCAVLDLDNATQALTRLDPEEHALISSEGIPGAKNPLIRIVNESGLYSLVLGSRKPEAKIFKRWITTEVLPAIRKTGSYSKLNPANLSRMQLLTMAIEAEQERLALACKVEVLEPKANALDRLSSADGSTCITNAAKELKLQPKKLFAWLQENQWIYRRAGGKTWLGYQTRIQQGLLEHKVTTIQRGDGSEKMVEQVLVTAKGLARLSSEIAA